MEGVEDGMIPVGLFSVDILQIVSNGHSSRVVKVSLPRTQHVVFEFLRRERNSAVNQRSRPPKNLQCCT